MKSQNTCSHTGKHRNCPVDPCLSHLTLFSLSCDKEGLEILSQGRKVRFSKSPVNKLWKSPGRRLAGQPFCIYFSSCHVPRQKFLDNPQGKCDPLKFLVVSTAADFFTPPKAKGPSSSALKCHLAGYFFAVGQFISTLYHPVRRGQD